MQPTLEAEYAALQSSDNFTWQSFLDYKPSSVQCPAGIEPLVRSLSSLLTNVQKLVINRIVRCVNMSMPSCLVFWVHGSIALVNTSLQLLTVWQMLCVIGSIIKTNAGVWNPQHDHLLTSQP